MNQDENKIENSEKDDKFKLHDTRANAECVKTKERKLLLSLLIDTR